MMNRHPFEIAFPAPADEARAYIREAILADAHLGGYRRVRDVDASTHAKAGVTIGPDKPFVCVIGSFDGLHLGHRDLIDKALDDARAREVPLAIVTFNPDPSEVLSAFPSNRLLEDQARVRALGLAGADAVVAFHFTMEFSRCTCEQFVTQQLAKVVQPVAIHVGSDFTFGAGRAGTPAVLAELGRREGFEVITHDLVSTGDEPASSTLVRQLISKGDLDSARSILCRSHYIMGKMMVVEDDGGGVCQLDERDCIPPDGKYGAYAVVGEKAFPCMTLIRRQGPRKRPAAVIVPLMQTGLRPGFAVRVVLVRRLSGILQDNPKDSSILGVRECLKWVHDYLGESFVEVGR